MLYQKGQLKKIKLHFMKLFIMREMKLNIEKGSEDGGKRQLHRHQAKSRNFIHKKEKTVGRCEDIKNDIFDLVPQG